ncbi:TolC family protein [Legionella micdadei]|uniref:TolC family protein n=1 Tax=Legionella micdadei TaxID=451 RepID=UPI0009EF7BDC|nr:TolC family protein [Legionella micdadei]ARH00717.1 multidrug transporter [Legionella micdadei]
MINYLIRKYTSLFHAIFLIMFLLCSPNSFSRANQELKLADILEKVDQFYPQVIIAYLEISKAQGDYISALGKFDPSLNINSRSQPFGGYVNTHIDNEVVVPTLKNGLKLFGGYRIGRGDWPIYYQNYLTNSGGEYRVGLSFPLLRNRAIDKERTALFTQAETIHLNNQNAASTKIKIYQEAIQAYWRWVEAGFQLKAFRHLLSLAQKRQNAITKQATQGELAKLAIAENLQMMIQREQFVNQGEMMLEQAAINLSIYYRDGRGRRLKPKTSQLPHQIMDKRIKTSTGFEKLKSHPALRKMESYYRIIKMKQNLARNDLLPNLDAMAYTSKQYGSGGYPRLIPQAALVGISFKFPFCQREAKGRLLSSTSELQQIKTKKKFIYEKLSNELANLFIAIRMYTQQINLLTHSLRLAKKVERGEIKKFYEGDSTLFLVNQREQTSTQVRLDLINAQISLQQVKDMVQFFSSTERQRIFHTPKSHPALLSSVTIK